MESQSPSELQGGSIKITCNTLITECSAEANAKMFNTCEFPPPFLSIQPTVIEAFLWKGTFGETRMSKTGFTVDSFLRCFSPLTFYNPIEINGSKDKKIKATPVSSFHIFQFLYFLAMPLNEFDSTFFSSFSFLVSFPLSGTSHVI